MYSKKVMDIFREPCNMGEIKDADGVGKVGNPMCGDVMEVFIKAGKNKKGEDIIKDIKVKTFGCVAAIVTSSILTDLVKGKTFEEAKKVGKDDIIKKIDGLPPQKVHCSVLAHEALANAIEDYEKKR